MLKKYFQPILIIALLLVLCEIKAQETKSFQEKVYSPDKNYVLSISNDRIYGKIIYQINYKGNTLIEKSQLSISLDNHLSEWALAIKQKPEGSWMESLVLKEIQTQSVDTSWEPIYGERSLIKNNYNELILSFEQSASSNYKMEIQLRVYNEGIAIRYYFPTNPTGIYYRITEEDTQFTFPEGTEAWFEPWAQGPINKMPLSHWPTESERPLTLELENGLYACLTEAAMVDFVRTKFELDGIKPNTVKTVLYESVDKVPYFATPWRVILAAETPGELIENNDILLNLNEPGKIEDTSWIKPGKIVRDMTLSNKGAKSWIDFAAENNIQYVLFDCGWYGPAFTWDSDAGRVKDDLDLKAIILYGKEKGVGIWVYVNQQALAKQDSEIFPLYKDWGVVGVKYGFVQVGSHRWTKWLHESVQRAAENELMVNIHDEFRTTGETRTWPNIMTVEGIRGNEEFPDATHNTILPFTRFIGGMGDYTICYMDKRLKTTHAHQLALGVIYFSPLQTIYWYDKPDMLKDIPETEFFSVLPTVWDDTKIIDGVIGEHITIARRKKDDWFIGAITNNDGREVSIVLDFLSKNKNYRAHIYSDDKSIGTKTNIKIETRKVNNKTIINQKLVGSGGLAIWLESIN